MDNNGWPGKPGVPMNPERDGAHVLRFSSGKEWTCIWRSTLVSFWVLDTGHRLAPSEIVSYRATYLGPCLTPDEVQNLRDDLASAERERAHQHDRADRSAAEYAGEQKKREALQARVAELEGALKRWIEAEDNGDGHECIHALSDARKLVEGKKDE